MDIKQKWITLLEIASDTSSNLVSGMKLTAEQCAELLSLIHKPVPSGVTPDKFGYYIGQEVTVVNRLHGHQVPINNRVIITGYSAGGSGSGYYYIKDPTDPYQHDWGVSKEEIEP